MSEAADIDHSTLETHTSHIPHVTSGAYPLRGGNLVTPLVDGEPAFRRICAAVEAAQHSAWITIAFINHDFEMPGGHGTFFDVLDRAAARGIDVRVIFWRAPEEMDNGPNVHFPGTSAQRDFLKSRGSTFLARWDRAQKLYCQHQKSWLIDAGKDSEVAFIGGINLGNRSVISPGHGHEHGASTHDVYVEVEGPSATDVHHNFVLRWNEASERAEPDGLWPPEQVRAELNFPNATSSRAGTSVVQIQRTVRRGQYRDKTATPGGISHVISDGDPSIFDQYIKAINSARNTIYFEDQIIGAPDIIEALHGALGRGVDVVFLVPADPYREMSEARNEPGKKPFYDRLGALGDYDNFTLSGIASQGGKGDYRNIYVHAKICLVDDHWLTIGSTNIANRSFFGDTELNASVWDDDVVKALRTELLLEHLGADTGSMDDRAALAHYRDVARANASRRSEGAPMEGLAFALDPTTYAS